MTPPSQARIRVLVVDDSIAIRRLLATLLSSDPEIEVVGTAADGKAALGAAERLKPDLMTLDIEMPVMDGLETLRELRQRRMALPIIILSTLTVRGAETTLEALTLGANDYVPKPTQLGDRTATLEAFRAQLLPKIKSLHAKRAARANATSASLAFGAAAATIAAPSAPAPSMVIHPHPLPAARPCPAEIVAVGVSTGGPNALALVIPMLAGEFPVPIVIAQHIPPVFSAVLAQRLNAASKIRVVEARGGEHPEPGIAYLAPGGRHLIVGGTRSNPCLELNEAPPENSCRPSVDVLFRSVARIYGAATLGVVLTGMGQDGVEGGRAIRQAGGRMIVQDEATSVVWGMPGLVWKAGLAEGMFPVESLAGEIEGRVAQGRGARAGARAGVGG